MGLIWIMSNLEDPGRLSDELWAHLFAWRRTRVSLSVEDVAMDPVSVNSSRHQLKTLYGISMIRCMLCSVLLMVKYSRQWKDAVKDSIFQGSELGLAWPKRQLRSTTDCFSFLEQPT
jgi:hypothetical protein